MTYTRCELILSRARFKNADKKYFEVTLFGQVHSENNFSLMPTVSLTKWVTFKTISTQ